MHYNTYNKQLEHVRLIRRELEDFGDVAEKAGASELAQSYRIMMVRLDALLEDIRRSYKNGR